MICIIMEEDIFKTIEQLLCFVGHPLPDNSVYIPCDVYTKTERISSQKLILLFSGILIRRMNRRQNHHI